jgi:hypothetical protein
LAGVSIRGAVVAHWGTGKSLWEGIAQPVEADHHTNGVVPSGDGVAAVGGRVDRDLALQHGP